MPPTLRLALGSWAALAAMLVVSVPDQTLALDPSLVGQWSAPIAWPSVGVHATLLNNGTVMTWGNASPPVLYDPQTGALASVDNPFTNPVCGGTNTLADGRLITVGGGGLSGPGTTTTTGFSVAGGTWAQLASTNYTTWYASTTVMGDGTLLRVGGVNGCDNCNPENPERYDPASNTWTILSGATTLLPMYPFTFLRPDGTVAITGASQGASPLRILDPVRQTWTVTDPVAVDGASATMYDVGKVIKAGTASDSGDAGAAASTAYLTDLNAASPRWTQTGSMQFPRSFVNLTTLPDGTVLATGGETTKDGSSPANAVLAAEDWSPSTGGWSTWASEATPRLYHSTAILLPDARVFVSGSGDDPSAGVPDNKTSEIFSPPYLFKGPRPAVTAAPSRVDYGTSFTVSTPDAASIAAVELIRTGSTTHFFDQSARRVPLSFSAGAGSLTVTAPGSGSIAPPGYYLLFIVNGSGVPSVAPLVQLGGAVPPPTPATPMLGDGSVESGLDSDMPGQAEAFRSTATASGTIASLSAYLDPASAAGTVSVGLYSDSGGHPGTLLAQGTITHPVAGGWNTVLVAPTHLSSGTAYWLSLLAPAGTGTIAFRDSASGGNPAETSVETNLRQLPTSWSSGAAFSNSPASIYAEAAVAPRPGLRPGPGPAPTAAPAAGSTPQRPETASTPALPQVSVAAPSGAGRAPASTRVTATAGTSQSGSGSLDGTSGGSGLVLSIYGELSALLST